MELIDPFNTHEYVSLTEQHLLLDEKTKDQAGIFILQYPDDVISAKIDDEATETVTKGYKTNISYKQGKANMAMLRYCVKGWKGNVKNAKGEAVPFKNGTPEEAGKSISLLKLSVRNELIAHLSDNKRALYPLMEEAAKRGVKVDLPVED